MSTIEPSDITALFGIFLATNIKICHETQVSYGLCLRQAGKHQSSLRSAADALKRLRSCWILDFNNCHIELLYMTVADTMG